MTMHRVLVVDDYPDAARVICGMLGHMGYESCAAMSGGEAIALARSFEPAIALVDLQLPDVDGYEVARQLRTLAPERIFIAAVTGHDGIARAHPDVFDHHVVKPIDHGVLVRLVKLAETRLHGASN